MATRHKKQTPHVARMHSNGIIREISWRNPCPELHQCLDGRPGLDRNDMMVAFAGSCPGTPSPPCEGPRPNGSEGCQRCPKRVPKWGAHKCKNDCPSTGSWFVPLMDCTFNVNVKGQKLLKNIRFLLDDYELRAI